MHLIESFREKKSKMRNEFDGNSFMQKAKEIYAFPYHETIGFFISHFVLHSDDSALNCVIYAAFLLQISDA